MKGLIKVKITMTCAVWSIMSLIIAIDRNWHQFWVLPVALGPLVVFGLYALWSPEGDSK